MASGFPGSIDNFTDPLANSPLNSPSHATLHSDVNDAVEKIETYMGLVKVIPTAATNGTVGATGTVTIGNAVSSVTVSGAFSSLYDAYRIVVTGGSSNQPSGTNILFQLGNSSTGYYGFLTYGSYLATTVLGANQNNGTSFNHAGGADSGGISCLIDITNPFLALTTGYVCTVRYGAVYGTFVGAHGVSTSYSSFTLTAGAGTLTGGSIRVYGYRN